MAFDGRRVVLFGGQREDGITYTWNGTTWRAEVTPVGPPAEGGNMAVMAYDRSTDSIVLFTRQGETWLWHGATKTWTKPAVTGSTPPWRQEAAMAYDAVTHTVVLFGGTGAGVSSLNDTWTWNGRTQTWTLQNPAARPLPRMGSAMATDPVTGAPVLFGGHWFSGSPPQTFDDTWTWDGTARNWIRENPPVAPAGRARHAMANDDTRGQIVLFGGDATGLPFRVQNDTWTWNGRLKTWALQPAGGPRPRASHSMSYDGANRSVVLFGGSQLTPNPVCMFCLFAANSETWVWGIA